MYGQLLAPVVVRHAAAAVPFTCTCTAAPAAAPSPAPLHLHRYTCCCTFTCSYTCSCTRTAAAAPASLHRHRSVSAGLTASAAEVANLHNKYVVQPADRTKLGGDLKAGLGAAHKLYSSIKHFQTTLNVVIFSSCRSLPIGLPTYAALTHASTTTLEDEPLLVLTFDLTRC